jgi:hypothetical protein
MHDEFYIGYRTQCPPGLARHSRWVVLLLVVLVAGLAGLLAARQTPAEPGEFEFGVRRTFTGVLLETPLPILHAVAANGSATNYLLVGSGKHGLPLFARGSHRQRVRFEGSLIQKGASVMVEVNAPDSFQVLGPAVASELPVDREVAVDVTLTGELVDTKCYLGVMRPATGKVHRACAVRCLSGGVPPGLLLRDHEGGALAVAMTGAGGQPLKFDPEWAALVVKARGRLLYLDGLLRLEVVELSLAR